MPRAATDDDFMKRVPLSWRLTVAAHLRRETNIELQATKTYYRIGHDPDARGAASGAAAG
jgi:hypothetical protein